MGKYFYVVETTCKDPNREEEFNEWYNNTHIPDIAKAGCVVKATRFQIAKPTEGRSKYLAIYEIECDDFDAWIAKVGENMQRNDAERSFNASLTTVDTRTVYRQISSFLK